MSFQAWVAAARQVLRGGGEHAAGSAALPGADVSSFQGLPGSWRKQAGRISWAAVKFTELSPAGSYVSPDAAADWSWLKANGKARIAYAYGHPSVSATATVRLLVTEMERLGLDDGDGVALDLETTDGLSAATVADWARTVMGLLERDLDRAPLLYTFRAFAEAGNCAGLGHYDLWVADPSAAAGHPHVPAPWKTWAIHQFAWQPLDKDVARYASLADMRKSLGKKQKEAATVAYHSDGSKSLKRIGMDARPQTSPAHVLHLTAAHSPAWDKPVHDWINSLFDGKADPTGAVPKGITLRLPAK